MTITIKEYSWYQTPKTLHVTIKCPIFFATKNVDIFHSDFYVKVSHPPYIFELFFEQTLKVGETRCLIKGTSIDFEFVKEVESLWKDLNIFNFELSSADRKERRNAAVSWRQNYEDKIYRDNLTAERNRERMGICKSMDADESLQKQMQEKKEGIKREFEIEMTKNVSNFWRDSEERITDVTEEETPNKPKEIEKVKEHKRVRGTYSSTLAQKVALEKNTRSHLAPPRNSGTILINLTPRQFPGPVRESQAEEEEKWAKKRYDILKKSVQDGNGEELIDVESVLKKGEDIFKLGDYQSAQNIYTYGLEQISSECGALYSNRAACHLKLGNLDQVIEDASKALKLFDPPVPANAPARAKAMMRRGSALAELGYHDEAIIEFEEAANLIPDKKDEILQNVDKIRKLSEFAMVNSNNFE